MLHQHRKKKTVSLITNLLLKLPFSAAISAEIAVVLSFNWPISAEQLGAPADSQTAIVLKQYMSIFTFFFFNTKISRTAYKIMHRSHQ